MSDGPGSAPAWLQRLANRIHDDGSGMLPDRLLARMTGHLEGSGRPASVLMLMSGSESADPTVPPPDADVLLIERASSLRHHSGQVAFPGGAVDPGEDDPIVTALREAEEETGLDPAGVEPLAVMPQLYLQPSGFVVTPVLGYWREQSPVRAVDPGETARVARVPLHSLIDPANRFQVRYGEVFKGPAFGVEGLLVWGFTAAVLAALIDTADWERPWNTEDVRELADSLAQVADPEAEVIDR